MRVSTLLLLSCAALGACAGLEAPDSSDSERADQGYSDFLVEGDRAALLEALNFDCVFQSCDGDFDWSADTISCSSEQESCSFVFDTIPHDFVGSFDLAKLDTAIGQSFEGDDGRGAFVGRYDEHFSDEEGIYLQSSCTLSGYKDVSDLLDADGDITHRLHVHLLDCIFAIEDPMFDLLAEP